MAVTLQAVNPFSARRKEGVSSKLVLTFESVDEILRCDHSNETSPSVLSNCVIYLILQHFTKIKLEILLKFDFGHFWQ